MYIIFIFLVSGITFQSNKNLPSDFRRNIRNSIDTLESGGQKKKCPSFFKIIGWGEKLDKVEFLCQGSFLQN